MATTDRDRPRLVVADADAENRAMLREYLESEDMDVIADAADGPEAVSAVLREDPDVVVMDTRMPLMDGVRAAGRIHALSPHTQVVLISSSATRDVASDAAELGVYLVIEKDEPTLIVDAVRGAFAFKRSTELQ
jgi:CheY-like chemotaxis protein